MGVEGAVAARSSTSLLAAVEVACMTHAPGSASNAPAPSLNVGSVTGGATEGPPEVSAGSPVRFSGATGFGSSYSSTTWGSSTTGGGGAGTGSGTVVGWVAGSVD